MSTDDNTYGKNCFREVRVKCFECYGTKTTNMQCDTGTYNWFCDLCGYDTDHLVEEVEPKAHTP